MQKADLLLRTKLHPPFTRSELVPRPRLQKRIAHGLTGPLTLITAPAGFGKTTLLASCITACGMSTAWLSLDKNDNHAERFLSYLLAALHETDENIDSEAAQLHSVGHQAPIEEILTNLINDLETSKQEIVLVLDDYQFIASQAVQAGVAFLLEHCPRTFHLVISTRSDPPLPLAHLRGRGQVVELRAADLRFTENEAAQFLNDIMGLHLDAGSVAALAERTEGWITGLQMAALSMRDRKDVLGFVESFSGTNRYILDYLLEEVLAGQPPEIQRFLLYTSILERLTAPLCEALFEIRDSRLDGSNDSRISNLDSRLTLEYLERANLFLVPLDDERLWYRYHHLFADLLRNQLLKSIGAMHVAGLHLRASEWYEHNGLTFEAIHHASMASDDELVERLIEQHYMEMVNLGEMSWVRFWMGKLSKDLIYRRPWLCLFEALSRSWFGQVQEANILLNEAEKHIQGEGSAIEAQAMQGYHDYVKSRVTAMQGDTRRAIELCLKARENIPVDKLGLQHDVSITLGYEYFLYGDFANASQTLNETIQAGHTAGAINNPVAAYALLARMKVYQGRLNEAYDLLQKAALLVAESGGQYLGARGLIEVEISALTYERNDLESALERMKQGLEYLPYWGKTDDSCLAYVTLSRIQLALGNRTAAVEAIEKASQLIRTCGIFTEARSVVENARVKMWLGQADWLAINQWADALGVRFSSSLVPFRYEDELIRITQARVFIVQKKHWEAVQLLALLEESARSDGRQGRLIEILMLKAIALQEMGELSQAEFAFTECLKLAEPEGYTRIFLDEGQPVQALLERRLAHASVDPCRKYAIHLLSQFDHKTDKIPVAHQYAAPPADLIEPLSQRELEVLQQIALGKTNQEIARQLIISPGTVKAHTSSIYGKLDVANRTEAVARARSLGILP